LLQHGAFASFNRTLFKRATENVGAEAISNTIPGLKPEDRKELLDKFNKYLSFYKSATDTYSNSPSPSLIEHLKGSINSLAKSMAVDY